MHCYLFSHRELVNPYLLISFRFALKVLIHTRNFFYFFRSKAENVESEFKIFCVIFSNVHHSGQCAKHVHDARPFRQLFPPPFRIYHHPLSHLPYWRRTHRRMKR